MLKATGYLFIESDNEILVKAALVLSMTVISTNREMDNRLVYNDKIRKTKRYYTLPCEKDTLTAVFIEYKPYLSDEQVEMSARKTHEKYVEQTINDLRKNTTTPPDLGKRIAAWDILNPDYKAANLHRSLYLPMIFESLGYILKPEPEGEIKWADIPENEQIKLASFDHGRWNAERVMAGWAYQPKRDNSRLLHDNIKGWDELDDYTKYHDLLGLKSELDNYREIGLYLHKK